MKKNILTKGLSIFAAFVLTASASMTVWADLEDTSEFDTDVVSPSEVSISLQSKEAVAGETVEIPLVMHTENQCTVYDLLVEYDSRLELVEVQNAKSHNSEENGKKIVSLAGYSVEPYQDDTAAATILFNVPKDANVGDKYNVDFNCITAISSDIEEYTNYTTSGAVITISELQKTNEEATEASSTYTGNEAVILKDQKGVPGDTVEIPMMIYSDNQCTSYDLLVEFDSRLEFVGTEGARASLNFEENGRKFVSLTGFETNPYKDGSAAAKIKLRIPENAENDKYDVKFDQITNISTDDEDIENYRIENAIVTVTGGVAKKSDAYLELKNVSGMAGDIAVVQLVSNTKNRCSKYDAVIEYDARLTLNSVSGADFFNIYEENGKKYVSVSGISNDVFTDDEAMAALIFSIPENAKSSDTFKVCFDKVNRFGNEYGDFEDYTTTNAVISVYESTNPDDNFKDYKTFKKYDKDGNLIAWRISPRGDANGDGAVSIKDAFTIAVYCANKYYGKNNLTEENIFFGDVNDDGKLTIKDALYIARYIAKGRISWDVVFA